MHSKGKFGNVPLSSNVETENFKCNVIGFPSSRIQNEFSSFISRRNTTPSDLQAKLNCAVKAALAPAPIKAKTVSKGLGKHYAAASSSLEKSYTRPRIQVMSTFEISLSFLFFSCFRKWLGRKSLIRGHSVEENTRKLVQIVIFMNLRREGGEFSLLGTFYYIFRKIELHRNRFIMSSQTRIM